MGFDEAFSYPSALGKIISFKVNDCQFLEFVEDRQAKDKKRMVSVSFETENAEQMRQYLKQKGQNVPDKTTIDGAGNEVFKEVAFKLNYEDPSYFARIFRMKTGTSPSRFRKLMPQQYKF